MIWFRFAHNETHSVISNILEVPEIQNNPGFTNLLRRILKFSMDKKEQAYMTGLFFKRVFDSDRLPREEKKLLIDCIKDEGLEKYYYLDVQPLPERWPVPMLLTGSIFFAAGVLMSVHGSVTIGINLRYLQPVAWTGPFVIILGFVFLFVGGYWLRDNIRRVQLIKELSNSPIENASG